MSGAGMVVWALEMSSQTSGKAAQEKHLPKQKQRSDAEAFHTSPCVESVGLGK